MKIIVRNVAGEILGFYRRSGDRFIAFCRLCDGMKSGQTFDTPAQAVQFIWRNV